MQFRKAMARLDHFWIAFLIHEDLADAAFRRPYICEELLDAFDPALGESGGAIFRSVVDMDYFAIIHIVGVAGDFLEQFDVLADASSNLANRVKTG
jgi:hypothetical protein